MIFGIAASQRRIGMCESETVVVMFIVVVVTVVVFMNVRSI